MFLMQYRAIQSIIRHNRTRDPDFTCRDHGHTGHSGPGSMGNSANSAPKYRKKTSNGLNKHHTKTNTYHAKGQQQTGEGSTSDSSSTGLSGVGTFFVPSGSLLPPTFLVVYSCLACGHLKIFSDAACKRLTVRWTLDRCSLTMPVPSVTPCFRSGVVSGRHRCFLDAIHGGCRLEAPHE